MRTILNLRNYSSLDCKIFKGSSEKSVFYSFLRPNLDKHSPPQRDTESQKEIMTYTPTHKKKCNLFIPDPAMCGISFNNIVNLFLSQGIGLGQACKLKFVFHNLFSCGLLLFFPLKKWSYFISTWLAFSMMHQF